MSIHNSLRGYFKKMGDEICSNERCTPKKAKYVQDVLVPAENLLRSVESKIRAISIKTGLDAECEEYESTEWYGVTYYFLCDSYDDVCGIIREGLERICDEFDSDNPRTMLFYHVFCDENNNEISIVADKFYTYLEDLQGIGENESLEISKKELERMITESISLELNPSIKPGNQRRTWSMSESQLRNIVTESVKKVLNEGGEYKSMRDAERKNLAYPHNPSEDEMRHLHETELLAIREDLHEWYGGLDGYYPRPMSDVARFYERAQGAINKIGETLYGWEFEN